MADPSAVADLPSPYPTVPCNACQAPIIWAVTRRQEKLCVDPEPATPPDGQKAVLLTDRGPGAPPLAELASNPAQWAGRRTARRRHLDTCPFKAHYQAKAQRRPS